MSVTTTPDVDVAPPRWLPADFDPTDLEALRAAVGKLLARELPDAGALEAWLVDWSEVLAAVQAGQTRRRIAMTCDTSDEALRKAHLDYERTVIPEWTRLQDKLNRRYVKCEARGELGPRYRTFDLRTEAVVELFRDENVELEAQDVELRTRYAGITGGRRIAFRGADCTTQQVVARLEERDRGVREEAYRALAAARAADADTLETLFDEMRVLRGRIARNAGFPDFRDFAFRAMQRFDYGPGECFAFHDAVERTVVPALARRAERRKRLLGVDRLRPWDMAVDLHSDGPLQPFRDEEGYVALGRTLFGAVDPVFAEEFDVLVRNGLLDLMSRPGKATGGYNATVADIRLPFMFINAVGRSKDVRTLLHEGGHAFHTLLTRDEPVLGLSRAPIEFCEVASMAMEFMGMERFGAAFPPDEARAAAASLMEERLGVLAWIATVDAFQHWIYTHPDHSREERAAQWASLRERFTPHVDTEGLEDIRATEWHDQLHIFRTPFYYIEYGLALVGAMQVWRRFRDDPAATIADYRDALALGATRPLPDLFAAAGARFGPDAALLKEVVDDLVERLEALD